MQIFRRCPLPFVRAQCCRQAPPQLRAQPTILRYFLNTCLIALVVQFGVAQAVAAEISTETSTETSAEIGAEQGSPAPDPTPQPQGAQTKVPADSTISQDVDEHLSELSTDDTLPSLAELLASDEVLEEEGERCLPQRSGTSYTILDESHLLIRGLGKRVWLNRLRGICVGMRPNMVLVTERVGSSRQCELDTVYATARGGFGADSTRCRFGKFEAITPEHATALVRAFEQQRRDLKAQRREARSESRRERKARKKREREALKAAKSATAAEASLSVFNKKGD